MSAVQQAAACTCSVWDIADSDTVRRCDPCHQYRRGTKVLDSVSTVLRACWPIKSEPLSAAAEEKRENARLRGVEVDSLFSLWVRNQLPKIPKGTREDSKALFEKLTVWWNGNQLRGLTQQILADDDIAGTCDLLTYDEWIWDVKCVWELQILHELQVGFYANLYESQYKRPPKGIGLIHVTERFDRPRLVPLDLKQCQYDAKMIRDVWLMSKRRVRTK